QTGSRWALSFDMSSLSGRQEVNLAQLRVRLPGPSGPHNVSLDIFHGQRCRAGGPCARQLLLGTVAGGFSAPHSSWKVFEVTDLLRSWLHQAVLSEQQSPAGRGHWDLGGGSPRAGTRRHRRNRMERQRIKASDAAARRERGRALCRRVDMMVDFEQTGWGGWIVYPKKYNAYRCEGPCPAQPQGPALPSPCLSQSLLQLYKPNQVPCPSCSPVRMSPLSMLYYERGEVVVRHHEDMIVEECGCN
ncbi:NODAL protein, partial [Sterrhoptilus dennistouni]|nr:NODAL protein [Sterrhoptilus dennistouni]